MTSVPLDELSQCPGCYLVWRSQVFAAGRPIYPKPGRRLSVVNEPCCDCGKPTPWRTTEPEKAA